MLDPKLFYTIFVSILDWYGKPESEFVIEAYYESLATVIPDDAIAAVFKRAIARHSFFPTAEEIIACYEGDSESIALTEWQAIEDYVRGGGRRVSELTGVSDTGKRSLAGIGGLEIFRSDGFPKNRHFIRRDFAETWRSIARRAKSVKHDPSFLALEGSVNTRGDKSLAGSIGEGETGENPADRAPLAFPFEVYRDENGHLCGRPIA